MHISRNKYPCRPVRFPTILKSDLQSQNQYVSGLALSVLGDIATVDMANDLYSDIESIIGKGGLYLRKKVRRSFLYFSF